MPGRCHAYTGKNGRTYMDYKLIWERRMTIHDDATPEPVVVAEGDEEAMREAWDRLIGENRGYGDMQDMSRWATIEGHKIHANGVRFALTLIGAGTAHVVVKD